MDHFTQKRLIKFVQDFRKKAGQLPVGKDFEASGFDRKAIETAVKIKLIEQFYLTLTTGT